MSLTILSAKFYGQNCQGQNALLNFTDKIRCGQRPFQTAFSQKEQWVDPAINEWKQTGSDSCLPV